MELCEHCLGADELFDLKTSNKQKTKYLKKGPWGATKKLVDSIKDIQRDSESMLDVGGGIGVLQWEFLKKGGKNVHHVDSSRAYLSGAAMLAGQFGFTEKRTERFGDFVDDFEEEKSFDIVALDKVVCCYPDFHALLGKATSHSRRLIALSLPMSSVIAQLFSDIGAFFLRLRGSKFRPYIHSNQAVHDLIVQSGFERIIEKRSFPWRVWVYQRTT